MITNQKVLDKFPNQTWFPKGQLLEATGEFQFLGQKVALAKNGNRLLATNGVDVTFRDDKRGYIRVFDYDSSLGWIEKESVYVSLIREDSDVFAVSLDGYLLVTGEANNDPSAYQDKPYRGEVNIYGYNNTEGRYKRLDTLQGDEAFLAVSDDYTVVVGTSDTNWEQNIARVEVFDYSTTMWVGQDNDIPLKGDFWIRNTPIVDISSSNAWASVDTSADAKRIAGGVPGWDAELECDVFYRHGFVGVYEYTN